MDVSDPDIFFDKHGVCNHCLDYDRKKDLVGYDSEISPREYNKIINEIKRYGRNKEFDCIIGVSGGVDSSFLLHHAVSSGLRVLAVHVDAGWNSEIAVKNIQKLCDKLGVQLHTIVIDWNTIKELQRAYMFSGLPNLDIPQDHVFLAAMYKYAIKNRIRYMLNGSNIATEGILPITWGYSNTDYTSIKDVFKKNKRKGNLRKYPHFGLIKYLYYMKKIKRINLLNYIDYSKNKAIQTLSNKYNWVYYGGKHFESRFTKFFQSYYLPVKFGYDKRLAHLSSLVVGGELSRNDALNSYLNEPPYNPTSLSEDRDYILKKLDITHTEWNTIMKSENKTEDDYKNNKKIMMFLQRINWIKKKIIKNKKREKYNE